MLLNCKKGGNLLEKQRKRAIAITEIRNKRSKDSDYGARRKHAGIVDWIRIARTGFSILGRYVVLPFQISLRLGDLILGRTDID